MTVGVKMLHRVILGDARSMTLIPDESVQLVVTSPPYWQLKDYGTSAQIGFDDSYEDYINNLNLVWLECHRTLQKGCRLCINIGDQFARSVYYGRYKVIPIRTEITRFCETIGFDFMGSIIWQKVTTCNTTGGATIMGSFPYPRNGIVKIDYEFILLFKKHGAAPAVAPELKSASKLTTDEWNLYFNGHWNFAGEKQAAHMAMFPEELPRRLIRMFSFVGETVLDPFLGSGTTSLAAMNTDRSSVGYEISQGFEETIRAKLHSGRDLFSACEITFERDESRPNDSSFNGLPYLFKDPLAFDKKIDPRKLTFGSRISEKDSSRTPYHLVTEVLAPDKLLLDNVLKVSLAGIVPVEGRGHEAEEYLARSVRGKQVFLRFDDDKYDQAQNLLAYVYLKNKTFVNACLVRNGLAEIDRSGKTKNKSLLKFGL